MTMNTLAAATLALALLAGCDTDTTGPACREVSPELLTIPGDTVKAASGLQYIVRAEGTGAVAEPNDTVAIRYTGFLPDGTLFDSSFASFGKQPVVFPLNGVIPGFQEGISGMKIGGVRRLIIPPSLAYGADSPSQCIPPNSTLIFDVELLDVSD